MEEVKNKGGPYRFVGVNALIINPRDRCFCCKEKFFLTAKTMEAAINQYQYLLKKEFGFNNLIRDMKIIPLKIAKTEEEI